MQSILVVTVITCIWRCITDRAVGAYKMPKVNHLKNKKLLNINLLS
jgi:hypothetical protein